MILSDEALWEAPVITEYKDEKGRYFNVRKQVFVTLADGSERDYTEILTNVINLWIREMKINGIASYDERNIPSYDVIPPRREDGESPGILNMVSLPKERFYKKFIFMEYDYAARKEVPKDLSGTEIQLELYEPIDEYRLSISTKLDDGVYEAVIHVSAKDYAQFQKLETNELREFHLSNRTKLN